MAGADDGHLQYGARVNKDVAPAPDYAEVAPKPEDIVVFDDALINSKLGEWTERFNLTVGK